MEDGLEPILLFKVQYKERQGKKVTKQMRGVYYVPQRGVAIEGHISDGSVRSIARHIANTPQYVQIEGASIHPSALTEEEIENSISSWIQTS